MSELVVCSGKGGTGKTSVVASLATLARDIVLADCDVDAANLHLVLDPTTEQTTPFIAGHTARIRADDCEACGECQSLCRFSAIQIDDSDQGPMYQVDPIACEGCGVCVHFCPVAAIDFPDRRCGEWYRSRTRFGPLVHARLDVGAENSGKLVCLVREQARLLAQRSGLDLILVDGPPGIGCPVMASLTGADLTLLVTEPSLAGLHDLQRVLDLAEHFGVDAMVCINKFDLSPRLSRRVEDYCQERGVPVVGRIPFEPLVNDAQAAGRSLVDFAPHSEATRAITSVWRQVEQRLAGSPLEKGLPMRIAIPVSQGTLALHFGHCDNFELIDVDTKEKTILNRETVAAPPHQPGLLPGWLAEKGTDVILAGGMGSRALELFAARNISVIVGAPEADPESLALSYLKGEIGPGDNACDH